MSGLQKLGEGNANGRRPGLSLAGAAPAAESANHTNAQGAASAWGWLGGRRSAGESSNSECPIRSSALRYQRHLLRTPKISLFAPLAHLCCALLVLFTAVPTASSVQDYLFRAEQKEREVWYQDDYRISWLTVHYAQEGNPDPWGFAFWCYLGIHFEDFPSALEARRRALLGRDYEAWHGDAGAGVYPFSPAPDFSQRKPVQSERRKAERKRVA